MLSVVLPAMPQLSTRQDWDIHGPCLAPSLVLETWYGKKHGKIQLQPTSHRKMFRGLTQILASLHYVAGWAWAVRAGIGSEPMALIALVEEKAPCPRRKSLRCARTICVQESSTERGVGTLPAALPSEDEDEFDPAALAAPLRRRTSCPTPSKQ